MALTTGSVIETEFKWTSPSDYDWHGGGVATLHACYWDEQGNGYPGVMLPDGRFVFSERCETAIAVYRDEDDLRRQHPGARLVFLPDVDKAVNP